MKHLHLRFGASTGINTESACLALNLPPILAPVARPVAPASLAALPGAIADIPADYCSRAAMAALLILALLAVVLI